MRPPLLLVLFCLVAAVASDRHKILVYNVKFAHSHVNYLGRVADILVDAGHDVTTLMPVIVPHFFNGTAKSKLVMVPAAEEAEKAHELITSGHVDWFTTNLMNPIIIYLMGRAQSTAFTVQCAATLDSGRIEEMRKAQFDVYIVEAYDPCGMMLAHLIQPRSIIMQSTLFLWQFQRDENGLSRELSYDPSPYNSHLDIHSFWSRLKNVVYDAILSEGSGPARRSVEALFKKRFGPDYPGMREQTSRATWVFTNSEPLYDFAVPTLHKIIPLPGLGAVDPKPLDAYYNNALAKRSKAIIISFGSITKLRMMQPEFKQSFLKMFAAFADVTFVFKYEEVDDAYAQKELKKLDNVVVTAWMPQNDLLDDPRVVAFITHCGMGSVQEMTLRGKPGLFVPLFSDQPRNAFMLEQAGLGVLLPAADVGVPEKFIAAVREVLENEKYTLRAAEMKKVLEGKPYSSRELLLKHVDFAGKFGAAAVMRPRSTDMTWIEYNNADVWLFIASLIASLATLALYLLIWLIRCSCTRCFCRRAVRSDQPIYTLPRANSWQY